MPRRRSQLRIPLLWLDYSQSTQAASRNYDAIIRQSSHIEAAQLTTHYIDGSSLMKNLKPLYVTSSILEGGYTDVRCDLHRHNAAECDLHSPEKMFKLRRHIES